MSDGEMPPPPARPASLWIAIALALVTLAVYGPVAGFQFVDSDDPSFITANPHVRAGLTVEGFQWAWSSEVARNWHPITILSHMLDCQLFGVHPWWPHLVNALLHAANAVLLFGLFKRMTGAVWRSAVVAALFALHPLHVESVAWVSERKDVLSTLFWFLTIWAYIRYAEEFKVQSAECKVQSAKFSFFYILSLLFFALGLMSKPMLVTVPCTLLLLDYWPLGRMKPRARLWPLAAEKIPFFALSAALCVVTFRIQKHGGMTLSLQDFPLGSRLGNALVSYVRYIEKMFWPRHLAGLYPIGSGQWPWWEVTLAAVLLLALTALVLAQRRRRPYLAAGWFWYLGTLVPVIGLVQVWIQAMADRYTYVPLIGLFVILAWGGWDLACAWGLARFAPAATALVLAACAALTAHQEFYWKDSEALYKQMIDVTPDNYTAHNNLGCFYFTANRTNEAIANLTAAIEEKPDFAEAHNSLGWIFLTQKRYDEAIRHFRTAVRLQPQYIHYANLARALTEMAGARHDTNALAEAAQTCRQALRLNPGSAKAHHTLGLIWQAQGRARDALAEFEQAARLDPSQAETWTQLGSIYASQNRWPEAERAFRKLIRLQPNDAGAYVGLGHALMQQDNPAEAISFYLTAVKLNPADGKTECALALALLRAGRRDEAAEHCRQALRIDPDCADAQAVLRELQNPADPPKGRNR